MDKYTINRQRKFLSASMRIAIAIPTAAAIIATPVHAESSDPIEEIIVTATRRAGSIQEVPINISAIDGNQIRQQGFNNISDLLAYVPGINSVDQGGRNGNVIIVRGLNADPLGQGSGNDVSETVATYLGEVPVPIDFRLHDINRVEILLGPQGTLYGAGTLGGAVRYIPNKPDTSETLVELRGDAYTYSKGNGVSSDIGFTFNLPVSDTFALRASLDWRNDEGFVDYPFVVQTPGVSEPDVDITDSAAVAANFNPKKDANGQEVLSGRVAVRWLPTDNLDATLTYYFQNEDNDGRSVSSARGGFPSSKYESASRVLEPNEEENRLLALEITADLGFAELTSASGLGKYKESGQRDQTDLLISLEYSYEFFPTFTAFTREEEEDTFFNQEVRLVSTSDGPINWIVGGFYNKFETVGTSAEFTPGYAAFAGFDRPDDLEYFSADSEEVVEKAVFGEIGYEINDRWQITAGMRYYEYEVKNQSQVDFPLFDPGFVAADLDTVEDRAFDPDLGQKDDGTLFKINTSYQVNDDISVYATFSEGFRLGRSNGGGPCPAFDPNAQQGNCNLAPGQQFGPNPGDIAQFDERAYGPDFTKNYELGAKTQWLDGTLTINGAVFVVDWEDPQLSSATVNASIPITINATGAQSKGIELSGDWRASENLRLRATYSHTESELTADVPSLIRTITPPGFGSAFEDGLDGDRLPGSPENQFSLLADYYITMSRGGEMRLSASYSWQGDVLTRTAGRGLGLTLDDYGIGNLSIAYEKDNWSATLYVHNIFDEFAESGAQSSPPLNQTVEGASVRSFLTQITAPRSAGIRFNYRM